MFKKRIIIEHLCGLNVKNKKYNHILFSIIEHSFSSIIRERRKNVFSWKHRVFYNIAGDQVKSI